MEEKPIPIYVLRTSDVTLEEKEAVIEAIREVIAIADSPRKKEIVDLDCWRADGYKDGKGSLVLGKSVDWVFESAFNKDRNQVSTDIVVAQFSDTELKRDWPSYTVMITGKDLFMPDTNFVIGAASPAGRYAVLSTNRFRGVGESPRELIKQEVYHEFGHTLGLLPEGRTEAVEKTLGEHCTNKCSMRQGLTVPEDWIRFTKERIESGKIYCEQCTNDLKKVKIELVVLYGDNIGKEYWKDYNTLERKFQEEIGAKEVPGYLEREGKVNIMAFLDGKPAGFIRLDLLNKPPSIGWLYVEPEFRNRTSTLENTGKRLESKTYLEFPKMLVKECLLQKNCAWK